MQRTHIIGILNATPDSFYAGSRVSDVTAAVERARQMLTDGADWIEVGGESTGPGSRDVTVDEEIARTIPLIQKVKEALPQANLCIDTWKADVARAAIAAGARMVNDVTAGRGDREMFRAVADSDALSVLMYAKDPTPRTTVEPRRYADVVAAIVTFLRERRDAALAAGIEPSRIILDPGLGHFVSSLPEYSFAIIAKLGEFAALDCPILLSPSRKSFLAGPTGLSASERLPGTIAASVIAVLHGAAFIRTHDIAAVRRAADVATAIRAQEAAETTKSDNA